MSERGGREAEEGGYRTKNKNPTRQCGEQSSPRFWAHPCDFGVSGLVVVTSHSNIAGYAL